MDTGILATGHGKPTAAAGKVKAAQQNAELQSSEASPAPEQKPVKVDVESVDFGKVVSKVTEVVQKLGTKVAFSYRTWMQLYCMISHCSDLKGCWKHIMPLPREASNHF